MSCPCRPTQCFSTKLRLSFLTLQRGNAGRDALRRKEDAERPERHDDAERRTIIGLSVQTDALRRTIIEVSVQTFNQAVCASIFWRRLRGRMSVQTSSM